MMMLNKKGKQTLVVGALILSQTLWMTPLPVLADTSVRVAGNSLFSISDDSRAQTVQNNLDNALVASKDRSPSAVSITYVKGLPVITLGGYQVVTVDGDSAKAAGGAPATVAQKWADSIRQGLSDQGGVDSYVAQLTGSSAGGAPPIAQAPSPNTTPVSYQGQVGFQNAAPQGNGQYGGQGGAPMYNGGAPQYGQQFAGGQQYGGGQQFGGGQQYAQPMRGRVTMAPAGLSIPISLQTSISTQVAKAGDLIEAQVSQTMYLGDGTIPSGSTVVGTITEAKDGRRLSRSGELSIKFNRLRTPDGIEVPISGHLVGGIGKYANKGSDQEDVLRGEGMTAKLGQTAIRGGVGAGAGAALGTALGAIAGGGRGVGRGAWGGAAIGGGVGAATMLMRKGRDVIIPSGTAMNLTLDAPATLAGGGGGGGQIASPGPYPNNL